MPETFVDRLFTLAMENIERQKKQGGKHLLQAIELAYKEDGLGAIEDLIQEIRMDYVEGSGEARKD